MFGVLQKNPYQEMQNQAHIQEANKVELLLMVYDKIISNLNMAAKHTQNKEVIEKNEKINKTLTIIELGLLECLDLTQGEVAENLKTFYITSMFALTQANAKNNYQEMIKISQAFADLRSAWEQIKQ